MEQYEVRHRMKRLSEVQTASEQASARIVTIVTIVSQPKESQTVRFSGLRTSEKRQRSWDFRR